MVQWLRLGVPNIGGMGFIPGWGIGIPHGAHIAKRKGKKRGIGSKLFTKQLVP